MFGSREYHTISISFRHDNEKSIKLREAILKFVSLVLFDDEIESTYFRGILYNTIKVVLTLKSKEDAMLIANEVKSITDKFSQEVNFFYYSRKIDIHKDK